MDDEHSMLRELQQQQAMIEMLIETQRQLLSQKDMLTDQLADDMAQLWSGVSCCGKKRSRSDCDVNSCDNAGGELYEPEYSDDSIVYRSCDLGEDDLSELDNSGHVVKEERFGAQLAALTQIVATLKSPGAWADSSIAAATVDQALKLSRGIVVQ